MPSNEESLVTSTSGEIEIEEGNESDINAGNTNRVEDEDSPPLGTAEHSINNSNDPGDPDGSRPDPSISSRPDLDRDSTFNSVGDNESAEEGEEEEVFFATPTLPLLKQPRV
eukprot:CAMPEP_0201918128 /NCGR_PEP_ID=MMETSP0903-20130614/7369_1 /ASSEMBLY_ACC=CAM_ASM_000552 /TAXON_ID=420261 /ORGANISM="Thalassiosira antarctica, Strain CCMP982" /LENGTH=111 /DNA_ID=CAMNT_0048454373 /DNA_START=10 /DNA_END=342 /DNA_ORIENTATION=-